MARPGSLLSSPQDSSLGGGGARTWQIWAALSVVYVIWGSTYLAIRVVVRTMPPLLSGGIRFLIAGALLYPFAVRRGDRKGDRPTGRHWLSAAIIGGALLLGGNGLVMWAERTVPSGIASLIIATVPLWIVLVGAVALRERTSWREALGIAVGFGGVALLIRPSGGEGLDPTGTAMLFMAALFWASGSLYARRAPLPARSLVGTAMQMLAGGVILVVAGIASGELSRFRPSEFSAGSIAGLAYLVVFGSLVGFTAYAWLLRVARTSLVATYAYVNPVVAVFLGWAVLGESITGMTLLAGAVILAAVALIVSARSAEAEEAEAVGEPAPEVRLPAGEPAAAPTFDEGDLEPGGATA